MAAVTLVLITTIISFFVVAVTAEFVSYVKPQGNDFSECPSDPCLTLDNYTQNLDEFFISNTEFVFLPGNHQIDSQLSLQNLTNVTFRGDLGHNDSVIVFAPLARINWMNCTNISIVHLVFLLSGTADIDNFFISMQFFRSVNSQLIATTFAGGQSGLHSTAIRCYESSINISNSTFFSCSSYVGAGIAGYRCSLYSNINLFINNSAEFVGGAIAVDHSKVVFIGRNSFVNNTALLLSGGAISSLSSKIEMSGNSLFIGNSVTASILGRGGALWSDGSKLHITDNAYFINNFGGSQGGALYTEYASVLSLSGDIYFEGNTALVNGGGIYLRENSTLYGFTLHK